MALQLHRHCLLCLHRQCINGTISLTTLRRSLSAARTRKTCQHHTVACKSLATQPRTQSNPACRTPSSSKSQESCLTFQEAVVRLQEYWSSRGCTLWQPHNSEVGAGTMNPATFLRVTGPEPWKVCYVEPSVRPDDSRYGQNPNRLQQHTQLQIVLKPIPTDAQEMYVHSLEFLGIDTKKHDVRFVEDNWENPALGAWGLGWEVWMDGQEITQFTYFQQAGGQTLGPPSVEITYGLERIIAALQGVNHFKDIQYNALLKYGDIYMQQEHEMSCYYLDEADVRIQQRTYELLETEANSLLIKKLPVPAYQQLLKLSHCFNILDARGAVGVTQRANCFATMRQLAKRVTELWMERRLELGHPLGTSTGPDILPPGQAVRTTSNDVADLIVELGCEELPPADIHWACNQLRVETTSFLERLRLPHGKVSIESTPRRLIINVAAVAGQQTDLAERIRGPPAKVAFGEDKSPTKALVGFCKKNSVEESSTTLEDDDRGVKYVWAERKEPGRPTAMVLTEKLEELCKALSFQRSMRWDGPTPFSRPVRWLFAMHGDCVLPFTFAGLRAQPCTRGLRGAPDSPLSSLQSYRSVMAEQGIITDRAERRAMIWQSAAALAADCQGRLLDASREDVLEEVTDLVEAPTLLAGHFDTAFLRLPQEVLITVMRKHQRYFSVVDKAGSLMPVFIAVANGLVDPATVVKGNEAVLQARFEDALFFYNADCKLSLADFRPSLSGISFQRDLGSMLEKSERVERLVPALAGLAGLAGGYEVAHGCSQRLKQQAQDVMISAGAGEDAREAARLAKADLATAMVKEMTDLAGTMGRHYSLKDGTSEGVAQAIYESTLPKQAGGALPLTPAGVLCSVADRLDSLVGLFGADQAPSASADIYGLRRAAYGMLETLLHNNTRLDMRRAIESAADLQPLRISKGCKGSVFDFVVRRLEQLFVDAGVPVEVTRAILSERSHDAVLARTSAKELQAELEGSTSRLHTVATVLSRPVRLTRGRIAKEMVDVSLFQHSEEQDLFDAANQLAARMSTDISICDFLESPSIVQVARQLEGPMTSFFDSVFVMCEDERIRDNRLALLSRVAQLSKGIVDLTALPGF